jgi:hypothetical protein
MNAPEEFAVSTAEVYGAVITQKTRAIKVIF